MTIFLNPYSDFCDRAGCCLDDEFELQVREERGMLESDVALKRVTD